jgi:tRNA (guanine9-N1)-methyltransferase
MGNLTSLGFALPLFYGGGNVRALQNGGGGSEAAVTLPPPASTQSKRAQKRAKRAAIRSEELAIRKRARREVERAASAAKNAEREERRQRELAAMAPVERDELLRMQRERAIAARKAEREEKERTRRTMREDGSYRVCIDLGWNEFMMEKELRSLVKQLAYSYSVVRKAAEEGREPLRLSVTGVDARLEELMTKHTSGWEDWPITMSREMLHETHPLEDIVYLTHDAEDVLTELDPTKVYVIGGIVDRNRLKGATLQKANSLGVATAKLNLDTSVHIGTGTPVLTVNHCVDILLRASHGVPWQEAYIGVLPPRKNLKAKAMLDGSGAE